MRAWNVLNDGYLDDLFKCSLEEINDVYKDYMKFIKLNDYMNWQFEMNELQKR